MSNSDAENKVVDLMAALETSVTSAKKRRVAAEVQEALAVHDAEHAYLADGHPDVLVCVWCQS